VVAILKPKVKVRIFRREWRVSSRMQTQFLEIHSLEYPVPINNFEGADALTKASGRVSHS
jgi:hypothetical protein